MHDAVIVLEKTGETYTWNEWISLDKEVRYRTLQINGPGHIRKKCSLCEKNCCTNFFL